MPVSSVLFFHLAHGPDLICYCVTCEALRLVAVLPRFPPEGLRELRQRQRYTTWMGTLRDGAVGFKWKMSYLMTRGGKSSLVLEGKIPERALQMIRKISLFRNVDSNNSDRACEHTAMRESWHVV